MTQSGRVKPYYSGVGFNLRVVLSRTFCQATMHREEVQSHPSNQRGVALVHRWLKGALLQCLEDACCTCAPVHQRYAHVSIH